MGENRFFHSRIWQTEPNRNMRHYPKLQLLNIQRFNRSETEASSSLFPSKRIVNYICIKLELHVYTVLWQFCVFNFPSVLGLEEQINWNHLSNVLTTITHNLLICNSHVQ